MTLKDIVEEYKKIFILVVESLGRKTKNQTYLNVEKLLTQDEVVKNIDRICNEGEVEFKYIVGILISLLLRDIYGIQKLKTWDEEKIKDNITSFYVAYLKNATTKFCNKYGLEEFDDPELVFKIISLKV